MSPTIRAALLQSDGDASTMAIVRSGDPVAGAGTLADLDPYVPHGDAVPFTGADDVGRRVVARWKSDAIASLATDEAHALPPCLYDADRRRLRPLHVRPAGGRVRDVTGPLVRAGRRLVFGAVGRHDVAAVHARTGRGVQRVGRLPDGVTMLAADDRVVVVVAPGEPSDGVFGSDVLYRGDGQGTGETR